MDLTTMKMTAASDEPTFEEALASLERIVRQLEDNTISLDEAMHSYEAGITLIRRCQEKLRLAEQRILLLTGIDENNQPSLQPFAHEATVTRRPVRKRGDDSPTSY